MLGLLLVLCSRQSDLARAMVDDPVACLCVTRTGTVVRNFATGEELVRIPDPESRLVYGGGCDATYDARSRELYVLVSHWGEAAATLFIGTVPRTGRRVAWRTLPLPERKNWIHPPEPDADIPQGNCVAERVFVNQQYIVVAYTGPRLRLFDRRTLRPYGESIFGDPSPPAAFTEDTIVSLTLGNTGPEFVLGANCHMMHNYEPTMVRVGRIASAYRTEEVGSPDYPEAAGTFRYSDGSWAVIFTNGYVRRYRIGHTGHVSRLANRRLGSSARGWAYDPTIDVAYTYVSVNGSARERLGYVRHVSHLGGKLDTVAGRVDTGSGREPLTTFSHSRWLAATESESRVAWFRKSRTGVPVHVFTALVPRNKGFTVDAVTYSGFVPIRG